VLLCNRLLLFYPTEIDMGSSIFAPQQQQQQQQQQQREITNRENCGKG
jgi:hypothetical protein